MESHLCRHRDFPQEEVKKYEKSQTLRTSEELRLETRQVLADARRFGAMASSPSSSVDERTANRIRELITRRSRRPLSIAPRDW